jgi:hypothetical protein
MALYWIVHQVGREKRVFIQEAGAPLSARLKAAIAGHGGDYVEHHALDAKTAAKIPKGAIGRVLGQAEAQALLDRIAGRKRGKRR